MAEFKEPSMHCHLPPELAAKASRELNETPTTRRQALAEFRRALNESTVNEDDSTLLRFLRCKKLDVPRAVSVYEGYHLYRSNNPDLFRDVTASSVSHIWESGLLGALQTRDKNGRAVMTSFPGRWDPETHQLEDILRAMVLQLEHLIKSTETQVTGIVLIADFRDFSLYQARCIRPWFFQMMSSLVQVSQQRAETVSIVSIIIKKSVNAVKCMSALPKMVNCV